MIELALSLALLGLLLLIALPRVQGYSEAAALRLARADVLAALDAARGSAVRRSATVALERLAGGLVIRGTGVDTAAIWHGPGPVVHGVSVTGLERPIFFGSEGLATGVSNRTIRFQIGRSERRLVISRLGRIR
jgi:Tfp pilus assembly protein FimT